MKLNYEKVFNSNGPGINVDSTWDRHRKGNDREADRYDYSLSHCYGKVLEVGAGDGFFSHLAAKREKVSEVVALEIQDAALIRIADNFEGVAEAHKVTVIKGAIENFQTAVAFDTVHCGHTLEHVLDFEKSLQALQDIHCDNFIISVPICGGISKQHLREWRTTEDFIRVIIKYFHVEESRQFPRSNNRASLVVICKQIIK